MVISLSVLLVNSKSAHGLPLLIVSLLSPRMHMLLDGVVHEQVHAIHHVTVPFLLKVIRKGISDKEEYRNDIQLPDDSSLFLLLSACPHLAPSCFSLALLWL